MNSSKSINSMIAFEINSIISKISQFLDSSPQNTMASGCLATAAYLINKHDYIDEDIEFPQSPERLPEEDESESDSDQEDEPSKPKRDLRQEWSGPLPKRHKPAPRVSRHSKPQKLAKQVYDRVNGLSGGDPNDYEVIYDQNPNAMCGGCRAPLHSHPEDKNCERHNGELPVIICDGTRVYF